MMAMAVHARCVAIERRLGRLRITGFGRARNSSLTKVGGAEAADDPVHDGSKGEHQGAHHHDGSAEPLQERGNARTASHDGP